MSSGKLTITFAKAAGTERNSSMCSADGTTSYFRRGDTCGAFAPSGRPQEGELGISNIYERNGASRFIKSATNLTRGSE